MAAKKINPRKKKLDAICTKIAMFMVEETFSDEPEAQQLLSDAIRKLEEAAKLLVANDAAAAAEAQAQAQAAA